MTYFARVALLAALVAPPMSVVVLAHETDEKTLAQASETFKVYVGRVKGDSVRLRTGAGVNHPPIYVFDKAEEMIVVGLKEGWAEVRLPKNAPCWVSSEFVTVSADGKSYTVKGERVNLRGSADTTSFPIGQVKKDAVLTAVIDGQSGKAITTETYVRVIAPAEAHGFVASEFIEKVRDMAPEKLDDGKKEERKVDPNAVVEKPAPEGAPKSDSGNGEVIPPKAEEKKPEVKRAATKEELEDEAKTFAELKNMLRDELKKPAADVNLTNLRKMFEQYSEFALDEKLRGEAKGYIEKIDATVKLIDGEKKRLADEQAKRDAEVARIKKEALEKKPVEEGPVTWLAEGTVGATGKMAKTPASHRLFGDDDKVLYDLRWDKGDLSEYAGKYVRVSGEIKQYDGWANKVIVIKKIEILIQDDDK
jgi:uncharacterized protein YgiM (DUF1202 family)